MDKDKSPYRSTIDNFSANVLALILFVLPKRSLAEIQHVSASKNTKMPDYDICSLYVELIMVYKALSHDGICFYI